MFKELTAFTFKINDPSKLLLPLDGGTGVFSGCGPTQDRSIGFVSPRGPNEPFSEYLLGFYVMKVVIETKSVPKQAIDRAFDAKAADIESLTGRKPGRKESKGIRAELLLELLPVAFPKTKAVPVWFDIENEILLIGSTSSSVTDEVITHLVRHIDGLFVAPIQTLKLPQLCMTAWLTDYESVPGDFSLGRQVELQSSDELKSVVKFDRHHLDDEQMRLHIGQGKLPTKLALEHDGRVSFVLTDKLAIKKIKLLDIVFDGDGEEAKSSFEADVTIEGSEIRSLVLAVIDALGGTEKQA